MKNSIITCILLILNLYGVQAQSKTKKYPVNYTIILDLSDRILTDGQLHKDMFQIEQVFRKFESKARSRLVLTSKDRFSVKIVPQNNSPLDMNYFENRLQLKLDEIPVKDKNNKLTELSTSISRTLEELIQKSKYSKLKHDYFGVDLWSYLNKHGKTLQQGGYDNKVLVLTDGYFDFENNTHVLKKENRYTSTGFLREITGMDWRQQIKEKDYGLIPIQLPSNIKWIISGISSKNKDDVLQEQKLIYFWKKWLRESGTVHVECILDGSETQIKSRLLSGL